MNNTTPTSLEAILRRFYMNKRADQALPEAIAAIQALIPEKPSNELIQAALQNGKPQLAASYNGFAAAITTIQRNFTGQTDNEREDSRI